MKRLSIVALALSACCIFGCSGGSAEDKALETAAPPAGPNADLNPPTKTNKAPAPPTMGNPGPSTK